MVLIHSVNLFGASEDPVKICNTQLADAMQQLPCESAQGTRPCAETVHIPKGPCTHIVYTLAPKVLI